jgi:hypothetical protein
MRSVSLIPLALTASLAATGCAEGDPGGLASSSGTDASVVVVPGSDSEAPLPPSRGVSEVFGHSSKTLYRLDPLTKAVTVVGDFDGCVAGVTDIALDKDSVLYGTTFTGGSPPVSGLVRIDRTTARCTVIAKGAYPNSLSFVPAGTLDPTSEVLVGYQGSTYVRIDTRTGAITPVGSLGGGYQSSGDIVSVIGGKTFLTVNGNECGDCLVEVDPATGALVKNWGAVNYPSVWGLAFWGGTVYGFSNQGKLFSVDFDTSRLRVTAIPIPNAPTSLSFFGAGSATSAPVEIPR